MKNIVGSLFIIAGILMLGYQGVSYTTTEQAVQMGNIDATADQQESLYFPPIVGTVCLAMGVMLVIIGRRKKRRPLLFPSH